MRFGVLAGASTGLFLFIGCAAFLWPAEPQPGIADDSFQIVPVPMARPLSTSAMPVPMATTATSGTGAFFVCSSSSGCSSSLTTTLPTTMMTMCNVGDGNGRYHAEPCASARWHK